MVKNKPYQTLGSQTEIDVINNNFPNCFLVYFYKKKKRYFCIRRFVFRHRRFTIQI